jgi:predicted phage terminase large subunit-like protein
LGLGDDLVKDRTEAESPAIRKSTREWYEDVFTTRAAPDAIQVMIGTRWHEDDVLGNLVDRDGWVFLNLPMLAEEDDVLGRVEGELLWPERFGPNDFPRVERGEISSRSFAALYQQRPSPASGNIFKAQWFENRYAGGLPNFTVQQNEGAEIRPGFYEEMREVPGMVHVVQAIDCAAKTGEMNDYSVIATIASDGVDFYVVDLVRERLEFFELKDAIIKAYRKWNPTHIFIESASSGIPIEQELRRVTSLPIIGINPVGSKVARATGLTHWFESGRVKFPERAPWLADTIESFCAFPFAKHDDDVDAIIHGLMQIDDVIGRWRWANEAVYLDMSR